MAAWTDIRLICVGVVGLSLVVLVDSFQILPASQCNMDSVSSLQGLNSKSIGKLHGVLYSRRSGAARQSQTEIRMQFFDSKTFGGLFGNKETNSAPVETSKPAAQSLWQTAIDPSSGKTYYYNIETMETSWDSPAALISPDVKANTNSASSDQSNKAAQDADPLFFSFNSAQAPTHPQVSCSEFTAAGTLCPFTVSS
jgi:hypothetical protein